MFKYYDKEAGLIPDRRVGDIVAKTLSGEWKVLWFNNGYWFEGASEFESPIEKWCYINDLDASVGIENLVSKIEAWHHARNLVKGSNAKAQFIKLMEEAGELAGNLARGRDTKDDIGDILVVLILIALQVGADIEQCLQVAYEDIKDRTGTMVDGVFVKDE